MPIPLLCPCGKRLQVRDDLAGGRARCPGCKRILEVEIYREKEAYGFQDESREEPPSRIVSRDSAGDEVEEEDEVEEVEEVQKKPSSWVPSYCYKCDASTKCKRIQFWSARFHSRESSHFGNVTITRTIYRNIQQHQIFLCRECAVEEWKRFFIRRLVGAIIGEAVVILLGISLLIAAPNGTVPILIGMALVSGLPLFFFVANMMKLRKPTFGKSIMQPIAIKLARREISKHTGADTFFTSQDVHALQIR